MVTTAAGSKYFGNGYGRHRDAIGRPLGLKPLARAFLDHEVDQFEPLGIISGFRQQHFIAMVVVACIRLTHGTPRTRLSRTTSLDQHSFVRNGFEGIITGSANL